MRTWRNNLSPVVAALNCGQSRRTKTTLVFIWDLARQVRMCSTRCTAKYQRGLQYTDCPAMSWDRKNISQNEKVVNRVDWTHLNHDMLLNTDLGSRFVSSRIIAFRLAYWQHTMCRGSNLRVRLGSVFPDYSKFNNSPWKLMLDAIVGAPPTFLKLLMKSLIATCATYREYLMP
jgi:hypothetical protein